MTKVFFSTDTEIWCDGWQDIDRKFPEAFRRYVYGPTAQGDHGLRFQLKVLDDHGLKGTFFVEPLFSLRFGPDALSELVGLIVEAGQDVQLHLHTEWLDEAKGEPLFPYIREKRQHLKYFNLDEQTRLIAEGKRLLEQAGAPTPVAFRAGSFAMNSDTLHALRANGILFDSSYNACYAAGENDRIGADRWLFQPLELGGVHEYPLTVYQDRSGHYRHAQLGACAVGELTGLLNHAVREGWSSVVVLSHNFELLNPSKTQPDTIVRRRFLRLCRFLDRQREDLPTATFAGMEPPKQHPDQPPVYRSPLFWTGWRIAEQALRRVQHRIRA